MATMDLVIVHFESPEDLRKALASVAAGTTKPGRCIVVDNSVSEVGRAGASEVCDAYGATLITSDGNVGFGAGVNRGVEGSDAELFVVLNPDAIVEPDTLERLADHLDANPEVAAVSPMILNQAGRVWFAGGWINSWLARPEMPHFGQAPPPGTIEASPFLTGCVLALRRTAFDQMGGFDQRYFLYYEDVDLCWRLTANGWRNELVGTALAHHVRGLHGDPDRNLSPVMLHYTMLSRRLFAHLRLSPAQRVTAALASPLLGLRFAYLVARADRGGRVQQWQAIWRGLITPAH
ncbi:MAG: glycosyltransferase family 2 protein [Actinomycetia bacterium]|nr:glycosyltransferase family 2 protein [Actinomycetes bacterium]MCP4222732.1 glycosyltransferase family 2 protein [Actinomycetes bacterium]MCP5030701.1 glycosyltransferase family 2 protein [Actinomycetes bacterium]